MSYMTNGAGFEFSHNKQFHFFFVYKIKASDLVLHNMISTVEINLHVLKATPKSNENIIFF